MFDAFNAQAKSVGDLLSDNQPAKVVVPRFQRGFSWEKKHVEAFWNDIRAFRKESSLKNGPDKYFLGPIVLRQPTKDTIFLLDGQQRLATATILLSVLRDLSEKLGIEDAKIFAADIQGHFISMEDVGYSLELGELDKTYFVDTVQSSPRTDKTPKIRSHRNIQKAREFLTGAVSASVSGMAPSAALAEFRSIRKTIRTELIMASIPVVSERDAFKIFETLNDRGLRLSTPDLLLNHLMGNAGSDENMRSIRELWNDMIEGMGRRDINRFIRQLWVSKYGDLKSRDLFTALKEHIEEAKVTSRQFAESCSEECARYIELLRAEDDDLRSAARYVRTLVRDLGVEPSLPVLMAVYSSLSTSELEKTAKLLLVFITQYSIFAKLDSSGLENILFALARDIRGRLAKGGTPKECLALIKERLSKNAPVHDVLTASIPLAGLEQEEAVYVASRIAIHMQAKTKELTLGESNLEHIFPKKPSSDWKEPEKLEPYLWNIGNLTMLGKRLNNSAASQGFESKKAEYKKSSLVMSQKLAAQHSKWDEEEILARGKALAPLVKEIWSFENPSRV